MVNVDDFITRYLAVWNEPDAKRRRERIAELWTEDGVHMTKSLEAHGYEALAARITDAHQRFVQTGGFVFTSMNNADSHHNVVKFNWVMTPAAGGEVAAVGFDFFILDDNGRIRFDYQFNEPLPIAK